MAKESGISWTDGTWNPFVGCKHISEGCDGCYMFREQTRRKRNPEDIHKTAEGTFNAPLVKVRGTGAWKWPDGMDVFTASYSDWFLDEVDEWREQAWDVIRQRPGLRFFLLTKRPHNIHDRLPSDWPLPNVVLGVSIESYRHMRRLERLFEIPAVGRFLSAEPLIGPLVNGRSYDLYSSPERARQLEELLGQLDWIVVGGESGPAARPMRGVWARDLRDLAKAKDVPFHFKQWGEYGWGECRGEAHSEVCNVAYGPGRHDVPLPPDGIERVKIWSGKGGHNTEPEDEKSIWLGTRLAGRALDGQEHNDRPRVGRVEAA